MFGFTYASETLHVALISLPQKDVKSHVETLEKDFYNKYAEAIRTYSTLDSEIDDLLYRPLKYYLFGNYDVALISLVNNYKFAQKQLIPGALSATDKFPEPGYFQVINGSCPIIDVDPENREFDVRGFFRSKLRERAENYVCISNLKLNNKLLIGNGGLFLEPVERLIKIKLDKIFDIKPNEPSNQFFLQQTDSWFELTLIIFSDSIEKLRDSLTEIRRSTVNELPGISKVDFLKKSVYYSIKNEQPDSYFENIEPHIFADTHSYFGVNFDYENRMSEFVSATLTTQIEWQIKPGHFPDLMSELQKIEFEGEKIFSNKSFLLTGKTDYLVSLSSDKLINNLKLFTAMRTQNEIFNYVRRVKTRVYLNYTGPDRDPIHNDDHPKFKSWMRRKFVDKMEDPKYIGKILKELKISRNLRNKIVKIYYNYQNGIQDPILFTYFLDFDIFIKNITDLIISESDLFKNIFDNKILPPAGRKGSVNELEEKLLNRILIFDKAYSTRLLNAYHYEDMHDFDLDYNSSIQQLLSMYNTLATDLSNIYYPYMTHSPVVLLHLKRTVSNYDSINYDVYHLTSPEFVFFTIVKELLNYYAYSNRVTLRKQTEFKSETSQFEKQLAIDDIFAKLKLEVKACNRIRKFADYIEFERYFLDAVVLIQTCNLEFDLFEYWFWAYTLQTASMYDTGGVFNEEHFKKELFRLFFAAKLFDFEPHIAKCPLPELFVYWERYSKETADAINSFFQNCNVDYLSYFKGSVLSVLRYELKSEPIDKMHEGYLEKYARLKKYIGMEGGLEQKVIPAILAHMNNNYSQGDQITKRLRLGKPEYYEKEKDNFYFINAFMFAYLKLIYIENGEKITLLRRNWATGDPLLSFIRHPDLPFLYSIDQLGGIFFTSPESSKRYFCIRNAALQTLWHYSMVCKKSLYF